MKNRFIAVVLAVMVAGTLTACSGSGTKETQPATQATTQAKETEAKTTEAKETEAKTTEAKETEAKTTEAKETEAKTTEAKETEAKTTEAKETEAKTTEAKETEAKTTEAAETEVKTTEAKTTEAKTTEAAETEAKTTEAKETEAKTTEAKETEAKETEAQATVAETEAEDEIPAEAVYTLVNNTGLEVTAIKFYQNDIRKVVVNYNEPLKDGDSTVIKIEKDDTITPDTHYTISYQTAAVDENHAAQPHVYKNLGYETVQLNLLAPDAITGATPFEFVEPGTSETEAETVAAASETEAETEAAASETEAETERPLPDKAIYQFNNLTGEDVTELTLTDNATKKVVFEIKKDLADKESAHCSIKKDDTITNDTHYTLSFKTKSGYEAEFKTLSFEVASINLIAEDAKSGATPIEFSYDAPETEAETETEA